MKWNNPVLIPLDGSGRPKRRMPLLKSTIDEKKIKEIILRINRDDSRNN